MTHRSRAGRTNNWSDAPELSLSTFRTMTYRTVRNIHDGVVTSFKGLASHVSYRDEIPKSILINFRCMLREWHIIPDDSVDGFCCVVTMTTFAQYLERSGMNIMASD